MGTFLLGLLGCCIVALPFILLVWLIWALRHRRNQPSKAVVRYRKQAHAIEREAQQARDRAAAHCLEDIYQLTRKR